VSIRFAKDVIAVVIPVAFQTTEIEIGRDIGGTAGGVIGARDIPSGDHVRIAAQQHEFHTPAFVRFTDEVADRFLDVTAVPVIGFDPLDGLHHGRQAEGGLVIRQWREGRRQSFVGDNQIAHRTAIQARCLARIETTAGFGHGDPVFPQIATEDLGVGNHTPQHRIELLALTRHLPFTIHHGVHGDTRVADHADTVLVEHFQARPLTLCVT